jgi:hypothetical protein
VGTEAVTAMMVPSRTGDERFRRWFAKWLRTGASPRVVQVLLRAALEVDVRPLLPLIQAPTLVLHRRDDELLFLEHGRYLANHIPQAKLVELPGADPALMWQAPELAPDVIEVFLTGVRRSADPTRVLATVLFTDIVGSTQQASRLGDRRWREVLNLHDELARRLLEEFHGQLIKTTGDGILATFDGPAGRSAARPRSETSWLALVFGCGLDCTPVRSSCGTPMSAASRCTSQPGSWEQPQPMRS